MFWCGGVLAASTRLLLAALDFLLPTDQMLWPASVRGMIERGDGRLAAATLNRAAHGWSGRLSDFPPGTVAHFAPNTTRGFFLVREANGRLLAFADRSAIYGARVYWYDPLPQSVRSARGPTPGFGDRSNGSLFQADGRQLAGPVWRPLDPFPLRIAGDGVFVADHATCPARPQVRETWCT